MPASEEFYHQQGTERDFVNAGFMVGTLTFSPEKQLWLDITDFRVSYCCAEPLIGKLWGVYPDTWQVVQATFLSSIPFVLLMPGYHPDGLRGSPSRISPWSFLRLRHCAAVGTWKQLSPGLARAELHHVILLSDPAHHFQPPL